MFREEYNKYMEAVREYVLDLRDTNVTNQIGHRFSGLLPAKVAQDTSICIIGAGSIGGWTARILAKLGFTNLTVYDADKVEPHNVGVQPYSLVHLGMYKVEALSDMIIQDCGFEIEAIALNADALDYAYDYVIIAVDSIETRERLFAYSTFPRKALIDTRMSLGTWNCLILPMIDGKMTKVEEYKSEYLFSAEEALQEPCTARSVVDTPLTVAAYICSAIRHMLKNPPTVKGIGNLDDPYYRYKWVKSFNALTWDSITKDPEFRKLQSKYCALLSPTPTLTPTPTWGYDFGIGDTVVVKGGARVQITDIDSVTDTFNDNQYRVEDVRGWS